MFWQFSKNGIMEQFNFSTFIVLNICLGVNALTLLFLSSSSALCINICFTVKDTKTDLEVCSTRQLKSGC